MNTFRYFTFCLLILSISFSHAQKVRTYKAWVTLINNTEIKGVLYSANEDGIMLTDKDLMDTVAFLDYKTIEVIKIRRKGSIGKGAWVGAASGMVLGGIAGYASGDDPSGWFSYTAEEKILLAGIPSAVIGTGLGAIIGTNRRKYSIKGNHQSYASCLPELKSFALD